MRYRIKTPNGREIYVYAPRDAALKLASLYGGELIEDVEQEAQEGQGEQQENEKSKRKKSG